MDDVNRSLILLHLEGQSYEEIADILFIGRLRQARREAAFDNTVKGDLERALSRINQQAWLLRNVFWWYLLPPAAAIPFFLYVTTHGDLLSAWSQIAIVAIVFALVYGLNKWSLRKHLLPKKRELELLLTKLTQE